MSRGRYAVIEVDLDGEGLFLEGLYATVAEAEANAIVGCRRVVALGRPLDEDDPECAQQLVAAVWS